jgi:hypothetical protein
MLNPQLYLYGAAPSNSSAIHQTNRLSIGAIVADAVNISRMLEADGLSRPHVLPVAWQMYPSHTTEFLDPSDLATELLSPYNHGADGVILWGDDSRECPPNRTPPCKMRHTDTVCLLTGRDVWKRSQRIIPTGILSPTQAVQC